jgi:PAS domain S-box-containing protein
VRGHTDLASEPELLEREALRREVERLRVLAARERGLLDAIVNHSPHGIMVCDGTGRIVLINRAAERIWAGSATIAALEDWSSYRAFHPDGRPYLAEDWSMARSLREGIVVEAEEIHYRRFDGTDGVLLSSCAPIYDAAGAVTGALSVFADITRFKRLERALAAANQRAAALQRVTARLASTLTSEEVAEVLVHEVHELLGASATVVYTAPAELDDPEAPLRLAASRGVDAQVVETLRILPRQARTPLTDAIRTRRPVWLGTRAELLAAYPHVAAARTPADQLQAAMAVPIAVSPTPLGGFASAYPSERRLAADEREFLETLAGQCGQALERARLFEAERRARAAAETARRETALLYGLAEAVNRAPSVEAVYELALDAVCRGLRVERAAVLVYDATRVMRFVAWRGLSDAYRAAVEGHSPWSPDDPDPTPLLVPDAEADAALAPYQPLFRAERVRGLGFIPLVYERRLMGKFMVYAEHPRHFDAGEVRLAQAIARHVAEALARRHAQGEILRLLDEATTQRAAAEQAVRARETLLAVVSHDLRNPLATITAAAGALGLDDVRDSHERVDHHAGTILHTASRMARLIGDLVDVSAIDAGRLSLTTRPTPVRALLEQVEELHAPLAQDKAQILRVVPPIDDGLAVLADADRVVQVFSNVIGNAMKFAPAGGVIGVRAGFAPDGVLFAVSDTGPGIDPAEIGRVFDRFWQGGRRDRGGLGLGLSIARGIVEAHGRRIWITSEPGAGCTVQFVLPRA